VGVTQRGLTQERELEQTPDDVEDSGGGSADQGQTPAGVGVGEQPDRERARKEGPGAVQVSDRRRGVGRVAHLRTRYITVFPAWKAGRRKSAWAGWMALAVASQRRSRG